ncbi:Bifunctional autolysin precursor [Virgibacillus dokdonensis]|uniref:N-acetylmuramoyl-L-alanine amidase n=2 Tax=Virgibacillus dokdonensis TaxID=302167 RepID=A0A2K9J8E4_9BACI|nr:Bifunctional autolysin precursor [Virgibacillus dokdonensis]
MTKVKNKYSIQRRYVTNKNARPRIKNLGVEFLVAHETANNNADADAHYNYFQGITFSASAHTFIDDNKILEIIPLDEKAWHVRYDVPRDNQMYGDDANDIAIGTELCRTGDFNKAYDRYVWYHAYLCKKFGLNPKKDIVAHSKLDPSRRTDPQSWLEPNGINWAEFIADVYDYYRNWGDGGVQAAKPSKPSKPASKSISAMANEVIAGKHGNGHDARRKSLGITQAEYDKVRKEVNRRSGIKTASKPKGKTVAQMAQEVIDGKHGNGHANRRKSLGVSSSVYNKVKREVNRRLSGKSVVYSKPKSKSLSVGQKVTVKKSASTFATGESIASFVKGNSYKVKQVKSDRVLLDGIISWVRKSDVY